MSVEKGQIIFIKSRRAPKSRRVALAREVLSLIQEGQFGDAFRSSTIRAVLIERGIDASQLNEALKVLKENAYIQARGQFWQCV